MLNRANVDGSDSRANVDKSDIEANILIRCQADK